MGQASHSLSESATTKERAIPAASLRPDAVVWGDGPEPDLPWIPENLAPLWGSTVFDALTLDQRLRYNHYYALEMVEQFVWIENHLILKPLSRRLARLRPAPIFTPRRTVSSTTSTTTARP